jgi:hypothetical protein
MTAKRKTSAETDIKNIMVPVIQAIGRSGKLLYIIVLGVVVFLGYQYFTREKDTSTIEFNSSLIQKQINNVSKLVVTEGHFSEVLTYKDQQKYFMDMISFDKKALIVANATVTVGYDMSKIKYDIDQDNKVITITNIPEADIKIFPDLDFYDIDQSRFNPFDAKDYNKINKKVKEDLAKKVDKSTLKSNAQNRLISELSKLLILTNTMGWTLQYDQSIIQSEKDLKKNVLH